MSDPPIVQINAWSGQENRGSVAEEYWRSILRGGLGADVIPLPETLADPEDWRDPRVGWGIILPERPDYTNHPGDLSDEPEPVRALVAARPAAAVFRVGPGQRRGELTRAYPDGRVVPLQLASYMVGTGDGRIPRYLLIVGSPAEIPWSLQYDLQAYLHVGRLDLDETGLGNYVSALLSDWIDIAPNVENSVVWSVDHGGGDITRLMRRTVSGPIHASFAGDTHTPALMQGARHVDGAAATGAGLTGAMAAYRPGLIVTSSHGATAPLDDPDQMRKTLGLPVDVNMATLDPVPLRDAGSGAGAIWFGQACCSAGSDAVSSFGDVLTPGTGVHDIVMAVSACGTMTAPLPRALLGAPRPLRAFVGHVEPTFDWTLRDRETGQYMTDAYRVSFHENLYNGLPAGLALRAVREAGGRLQNSWNMAADELTGSGDLSHAERLLAMKLSVKDWRTVVLLGDPTVRLPL